MQIRRRATVITAVAGLALTGLVTSGPALAATNAVVKPAAAGSTARVFSLEGAISGLDATKGTVSVLGSDGTKTSINVAPRATVAIDGSAATLAKLPIGARVKLSGNVSDGVSVATRVDATTAWPFVVAGSVVLPDLESMTVSVKHLSLTGAGLTATDTYPVAAKAVITLDGRTVSLGALPARAHILVTGTVNNGTYSARTLTALSRWSVNLSGTVSAVDAAAATVTVKAGTPAVAVTLKVDPKASIKVNGVKVGLSDLPIGATVSLTGTETTAGTSFSGIEAKVAGKTPR